MRRFKRYPDRARATHPARQARARAATAARHTVPRVSVLDRIRGWLTGLLGKLIGSQPRDPRTDDREPG